MTINRKFTSAAVRQDANVGDREIRVIASTPKPDRVGDVMVPKGCDFSAYAANPIVLADHDPSKPIGTAKLFVNDQNVEALITFAPAGVSTKADEYCGLAKAGVLNAVSIGFRPVDQAPNKFGGFLINKWELMEISMVAVPANAEALVIQRSLTTKTDAQSWKVGASLNLPIGADEAWAVPAATDSIFEHTGFDGEDPDSAFARKGFLAYDATKPGEKGSYKLPFAQMVGGRLTAMPAGIRAAASRLEQTDIPDEVKTKARAVIDHYEAKISEEGSKGTPAFKVKGMWQVAQLAQLLAELGWAHQDADMEAEMEGDASKVPAMLATALRQLADAFVAMSAEETRELLDDHGLAADGEKRLKAWRVQRRKAGAVLSAANREHRDAVEKCLSDFADLHAKACNLEVKRADLGDEMKQHLEGMQQQMEEATKHIVALGKQGDGFDSSSDDDPEDPAENEELAADVSRRKRLAEAFAHA